MFLSLIPTSADVNMSPQYYPHNIIFVQVILIPNTFIFNPRIPITLIPFSLTPAIPTTLIPTTPVPAPPCTHTNKQRSPPPLPHTTPRRLPSQQPCPCNALVGTLITTLFYRNSLIRGISNQTTVGSCVVT